MSGDPSGLAAWKPAAVTSGVSLPTLLDSYEAERRPIAWLRHQQIFARADFKPFASPSQERIIDDAAMELGQLVPIVRGAWGLSGAAACAATRTVARSAGHTRAASVAA
jgi:hypothetical protein